MNPLDETILKIAMSEADYDGRPWMAMPRTDRDRYLDRVRRALGQLNLADAAALQLEAFRRQSLTASED